MKKFHKRFSPYCANSTDELNSVVLDHNYSKPWNLHPDIGSAQPIRFLFMDKISRPESNEDVDR